MVTSVMEFLSSASPTDTVQLTEWLYFAEIPVPSGQVSVCDPVMFPGLVVSVQRGTYLVWLKVSSNEEEFCIARLRLGLADLDTHVDRSELIGEVCVDYRRLTVGDRASIAEAGNEITSIELAEPFNRALESNALYGFVPWSVSGDFATPLIQTPDGDGVFPVYELRRSGGRVGIEIDLFPQAE